MKIFFQNTLLKLLCLAFMLGGGSAFAQEEKTEDSDWEKKFIEGNIAISEWFDGVADGLDLFLAGKRVTSRKNESFVRLESTAASSEGKAVVNTFGITVVPRLPNLEEYWHLKFATYDEREDKRNAKNAYLRQTPRQRNPGATVGVFRKLGDVRTSFEPRIDLQDPLKVSHSLNFESIARQKGYEINPKLELYADPEKGVGSFQALNFHFGLTKIYSLTLLNQGDYLEKTHLYTVNNGVSIGHILDSKRALSYNVIFTSNNQPSYRLIAYNLSVAYSQVLYKRILDFSIVPNLDFQTHVQYKGVAGITFNINLNF
ncbi:hypothetical protein [Bdellovibrio sp. HCB337]|uniref:hypothetical protein n=1 Tax=Bdellovibrio sp. HCB337 TaxID=3394358 RepID=UPI0039A40F87